MSHKKKLLETYENSFSVNDIKDIDKDTIANIESIGAKINTQKGVFTVLTTLVTHKTLFPKQDVRKHQSSMEGRYCGTERWPPRQRPEGAPQTAWVLGI